tara:strand:- start:1899 stop:2207 length:309 start_codon:yes stop_codon:yes gene_type:complete
MGAIVEKQFATTINESSDKPTTEPEKRTMRSTNKLDLLTEDLISLTEATKELPNRPHLSTVWRWTQRPVRGVKLETIKIGHATLTSKQAITRFIQASNEGKN